MPKTLEPATCGLPRCSRLREHKVSVLPDLPEYVFKRSASLAERMFQKRMTMIVSEKVEYDDLGGVLMRQLPNSRFCGVQSQLQSVEGFIGDYQFPVQDKPPKREVAGGLDDLREVSAERTLAARLQVHCVLVA